MLNKIIVLGMDNTGKTTLCSELAERLDWLHVNSLGPQATKQEMCEFMDFVLDSEEPMVLERFCFFEEMVYGKVLRDRSKFDWDPSLYALKLKVARPLIIYCRPPKETIFQFGDREQMSGVIEQGEKLLSEFDELYFRLLHPKFVTSIYNFEVDSVEEILNFIGKYGHLL